MGSQSMQAPQSQQSLSQQQQKFAMQHARPSLPSHNIQTQNLPNEPTDLDDSGIGMGLVDDDLNLAKFGLTGAHVGHDLVDGDLTVNVL